MNKVKAWVTNGVNQALEYQDSFMPISSDTCSEWVEVSHCALNLRDHWIRKGKYPKIVFPIVLGSDLAGWHKDKEVIVNPAINWGSNEHFQSKSFRILGMPDHGALAGGVYVPTENVYEKPQHLDMAQAAALPLAGLTAYRATMVKGQPVSGDKVLISGVGGGVALFAMQFAMAAGAEVYVTSSSSEKIQRAQSMGAAGAALYTDSNFDMQLIEMSGGGFDLVIDSAAGSGFNSLIKTLKPGGRLVFYGATRGVIPELNPFGIYWKQLSIMGSTMGSPTDFKSMLDFVTRHKIVPIVDQVFDFIDTENAFDRISKGEQFGKIVVQIKE